MNKAINSKHCEQFVFKCCSTLKNILAVIFEFANQMLALSRWKDVSMKTGESRNKLRSVRKVFI